MGDVLRTPPQLLAGLPDFPYAARRFERPDGLVVQYIDAGPVDAVKTWLCLHGQPTWSYLYRRMIPAFVAAGHRVIAPDFLGFGGSDKPVDEAVYTFDFHRRTLLGLIAALDLGNIVLVVQDWGGLIGLTLPMEAPERYAGLLAMNTTLATGDQPLGEGFVQWRAFSNRNPDMDIAKLMQRACPHLTPAETAAYAAPYPDAVSKAGVRRFPNLVPDRPDADGAALSRQARDFWTNRWTGRSLMAIGMKDNPTVLGPPVICAACTAKSMRLPATAGDLRRGGHFLQEWGGPIAQAAVAAL